jgi:S-formylglutathione hydrolase FrmB
MSITAYELAKQLNEAGKAADPNWKDRRPQQMYRYISQNLIPTIEENGQKKIEEDVAEAFISWFVGKHASK